MIDANRIIFGWSKINHFEIYNSFTRSIPQQVDELQTNGIVVEAGFIQTTKDVSWVVKNGIQGLWVDDVPYIKRCLEQIEHKTGSK